LGLLSFSCQKPVYNNQMILKEITNRRSVRNFISQPVTEDLIVSLIKAAQFAPTSTNNRAVEFIVIKDQNIKEKIFSIVGQTFIKDAPSLIVPIINTKKSTTPVEDLSIASAFIMLEAEALGLGTVWKHVLPDWVESVRETLHIPAEYHFINLLPLGYAQQMLPPHSDADFDWRKIHSNQY